MKKSNFQDKIPIFLKFGFCISLLSLSVTGTADSISKLKKTEILGKEYYIYEVKKGESAYGIAKKNGWDLEELVKLNPDVSSSIKKGDVLYYPTGQEIIKAETVKPVEIDFSSLEPIRHKVKKGETVYSISRQYNIPLDLIYRYNPSAKKGVKAGEIIEFPQNNASEFYFYTIKNGDSIQSISQEFNTSIEDILKNNAGLTAKKLQPGETIRISVNSNLGKIKTQTVSEERITQISGYKVSKNESWEEISNKTGVEVELLKEANEQHNLQENTLVNIPIVETVEVEKVINVEDQSSLTFTEVKEIYDSIKGIIPEEGLIQGVRMAVIMDEPSSKKDIDFTRGILIGIDKFKKSSKKIDLKVLDGRISTGDLISELDNYEPNIIVSTADKAFPLFLADYGNSNNIQIINVFDLKNDLFEDNSSMVQLLPPSGYFYNRLANRFFKDNKTRRLIAVGEEENDGMAIELFNLFEDNASRLSLEEFGALEPDILEPILIYSYASKKEDISDFFKNVESLSENNPGLDFKIIGRSNWIALTDDFGDLYEEFNVYIPSRVWMDEESSEWKKFAREYEEMFEGYPVRSIPNFAASGYDVATFFIPLVSVNHGDFNQGLLSDSETGLQNNIELSRVNNWGGFINGTGYIIRFRPGGIKEKIIVRG